MLIVERQAVAAKHGFIRPVLHTPRLHCMTNFPNRCDWRFKKPQLPRAAGTDCGPTAAIFQFGHSSIHCRLDSMQLAHSNQGRRRDVCESATSPPKSDTVQILVLTRCPLMLMSRHLIFQVHDEFVKKKKSTGGKNAMVEHS